MWKRLCNLLGREDLLAMPEFKGNEQRSINRAKLNEVLNEAFIARDSKSWIDELNAAGVPCGPIYRMDEVFADPQVQHLRAATEVNHPRLGKFKLLSQAARLSRTPAAVVAATPELGQHTDEILKELKYSGAEISGLKERGAV